MNSGSNNTNKLSPQEHSSTSLVNLPRSNNTNKLSPQEHEPFKAHVEPVQIIQINLVLKNGLSNIVLPLMFK